MNDPRAQQVFGVAEGDASVLFIKTRDDDEAETLAREIGVTAFLINEGLVDSPVAGNIFIHLPAPNARTQGPSTPGDILGGRRQQPSIQSKSKCQDRGDASWLWRPGR